MFTIWGKHKSGCCDGFSRRDFLKVGTLSVAGLTMADLLAARAWAQEAGRPRDTAVIAFWLDGGPTHMETYDPKPEAPEEFRGPLGAIATNVPGVQLSELLVEEARVMDKLAIVRSVHHDNGDHFAAAHWMWTGYHGSSAAELDPKYPSVGAITAKIRGANRQGMPPFVAVPYAATVGLRPGYQSGAYLGVAYNPFDAGGDPNNPNYRVPNLDLIGGMTLDRLEDRRSLLAGLDRTRREVDQSGLMEGMDDFNRQAFEMITGDDARRAFDIGREDPRVRDRYGRTEIGQSALLARRLVEAGVTFVSIHSGGWDNHSGIEQAMRSLVPPMDQAVAALVEDLCQRGLYERVLVMVMGEFGRTPRVNGTAGRDHWGNALSVLMAGGGLQPGRVIGATNSKGEFPTDAAATPADILATVYQVLGIDAHTYFPDRSGRPIAVLSAGSPIAGLV